ncbi:MAG: hypothetical protein GY851_15980 [bacterium]|nr:hypothetical protein [bacterium]
MKKGCLGALAVVLILATAAVLMINAWLGAFPAARRVPVAEFLTDQSVAAVSVDTQNPVWLRVMDDQLADAGALGWLMGVAMPHEYGAIVDVNAAEATSQTTMVISTRRFGPLLKRMLIDEDPLSSGVSEGKDGAILLKTNEAITPETLALAGERWAQAAPDELKFEGGHFLEAVVGNSSGQAFLGLEGLLLALSTKEDTDEFEKQQIFDADQLSGLFYRVRSGRVTGDFTEEGDLTLSLLAECPDAVAAETIHFALLTVRDALFRQAIEQGLVIEGEPVVDGSTVKGDFTVTGIQDAVAMALAAQGMGGTP